MNNVDIFEDTPTKVYRTQQSRYGMLRARLLRDWLDIAESEGKPVDHILAQLVQALDCEGLV